MMVFNRKGTLTVAILLAIYGSLIECQIEGIRTTNLNSTYPLHASTFGITYPSNTSTSAPTTQFSSVYFNVSDATFVQTSAYIQIRDAIVYQTNSSYTSATPGSITGSFGAIVPPCFPSNRSESYYSASEFNATTDALYGEATFTYGDVAVPTLVNGSTSFEIMCRVPGLSKCIDYYSLTISLTPVVSHLYVLSVTSTNNLTLHFALKNNYTECSSLQYPVSANKREDVGLPVVEEKPLDFWLGIETSDDSPSAQVQMWWILYGSDAPSGDNTPNSPSSQTPESNNSPSGNIVDELPRWALVLLIIFGIAVLALIIVVIVLCVKRNKRVQYSTM